jgi:hypothetical protein
MAKMDRDLTGKLISERGSWQTTKVLIDELLAQ